MSCETCRGRWHDTGVCPECGQPATAEAKSADLATIEAANLVDDWYVSHDGGMNLAALKLAVAAVVRAAEQRGVERAAQYLETEAKRWWRDADAAVSKNDIESDVLFRRLGNLLNNSAISVRALPAAPSAEQQETK